MKLIYIQDNYVPEYINQIGLTYKGIRKNKKFLQNLWTNEDFEQSAKWFDKISPESGDMRRNINEDMTLEKCLEMIKKDNRYRIVLQLASPVYNEIIYGITLSEKGKSEDHFAWFACLYTYKNLRVIEDIYKQAFKTNLRDEPVAK